MKWRNKVIIGLFAGTVILVYVIRLHATFIGGLREFEEDFRKSLEKKGDRIVEIVQVPHELEAADRLLFFVRYGKYASQGSDTKFVIEHADGTNSVLHLRSSHGSVIWSKMNPP